MKIGRFDKFKVRLLVSIILGIISCIAIYLLLFNDLKVTKETIFILFQIPVYLLKAFVFISAIIFILLTLYVVLKKEYKKELIFQIVLTSIIPLLIGYSEFIKVEHVNLYKEVSRKDLSGEQFEQLYLKAIKSNDVMALANLERNENIPDSIEQKLSYSEYLDIKQEVAWRTDSKSILIRLSNDINPKVRTAVATNKLTPIEIINNLQKDSNEIVRNTAFAMFQARTTK